MQPLELLDTLQRMLDFSMADSQRLIEMGSVLKPHTPAMAEMFYAALDKNPESKAILDAEPNRRARLHQTLADWYTEIFSGQYDEAYAKRRWIIGLVHVRIGIPPKFVVGSMTNVYRFSARKLGATELFQSALEDYTESLSKMLTIDLAFIEQSYVQSTLHAMATEMGANEQLFARFMTRGAAELLTEARASQN
jgi:hypothetical protein